MTFLMAMIQFPLIATQAISWIIAIGTTVLAIYYGRRTKPLEKAANDLDIIRTRNDFLEKRVEDLEDKEEAYREKLDNTSTELALCRKDKSELAVKYDALKLISDADKNTLLEMNTQVINSQVTASLMKNQVMAMAKRFDIPRTVRELQNKQH